MYKVFFNDRRIIISEKEDITINISIDTDSELLTATAVRSWFLDFVMSDVKEIILINKHPEYFWKNVFAPSFKLINAAGGVVTRNNQMLFILRNNKWDLPKGKIDKGEAEDVAALREVEEECGINGHSIVKKLPSTFHIYQSPYKKSIGKWILKETFWFEMEYNGTEQGIPQAEENITEIRWCEKNELDEIFENTYENLKQIISLYLD